MHKSFLKKTLAIFCASGLMPIAAMACDQASLPFGGGDGTQTSPYLICTNEQFNSLQASSSYKFYVLKSDLDFQNQNYTAKEFTGYFDGGDFTISNVLINQPTLNAQGVFGQTKFANIKNLRLQNILITGKDNVGGLIGKVDNGEFRNVRAENVVVTGNSNVGGLAGSLGYVSVFSSSVNGNVSGKETTGGLVGKQTGGYKTISMSSMRGQVNKIPGIAGAMTVGGLIGLGGSDFTIQNSYSHATVTGGAGMIGTGNPYLVIQDSYVSGYSSPAVIAYKLSSYRKLNRVAYDSDVMGGTTANSFGASGLTTSEMQSKASPIRYWDFTKIWKVPACGGYPLLKHEDDKSCP